MAIGRLSYMDDKSYNEMDSESGTRSARSQNNLNKVLAELNKKKE